MKSKKMAIITIIMWILAVLGLIILVTLIRNATDAFFDRRAATNQVDTNSDSYHSVDTKVSSENSKDDSTVIEEEKGETITTKEEIDGPVSLFDCWTTINDWDSFYKLEVNVLDNMGNEHSKAHVINDLDQSITVKLDKKYNTLEIASMYLMENTKDTNSKLVLLFYDQDGHELGTSPSFTKGSKPETFTIDVSNVEFLEISKDVKDFSYWYNCDVGIDEAYLY